MKTIKKELKQLAQDLRELKQNLKNANRSGGIAQYGLLEAAKRNYRIKHIAYSLLKKEWLNLNEMINDSRLTSPDHWLPTQLYLLKLIAEKGIELPNKKCETKQLDASLLAKTISQMAKSMNERFEAGEAK